MTKGVTHILLILGPVLAFMGVALVMVTFSVAYSPWSLAMRRGLTRYCVAMVFWSAACVLWLSPTTESQAAMWYRWEVLLGLIVELTMIEVIAQSLHWRLLRGWSWYYGLALAMLLGTSLWWHPALVRSSPESWVALGFNRIPGIAVVTIGAMVAVFWGFSQPTMRTLKSRLPLIVAIIVGAGLFLTDVALSTPPVYALGWIAPLLLWLFLGMRRHQPTRLARFHPSYLNAQDVWRLSQEGTLTSSTKGVLAIGWAHTNEVPGIDRSLVLDALGQQLVALCRRADQVVRLDTGEYLIILPEILFQDERRVRQRIVAAIDDVVVLVGDKKIPWAGYVEVGWAWAEPGVSLADVIQEARQSLNEECVKAVLSLSRSLNEN